MTERELQNLTKLIKDVSLGPDADEHIATILKIASNSIDENSIRKLLNQGQKKDREKKSGVLKFTKKEISEMAAPIRNIFRYNNLYIKYRYYKGMFQARYRRDGKRIEVASVDFDTMRNKFIEKFNEAYDKPQQSQSEQNAEQSHSYLGRRITFAKCAENWLKIKQRTTKPTTYKEYLRSYNVNLKPAFGSYGIGEITRPMIQDYLFSFIDRGRHRTAEKLKLQLTCIFDMAAEDYKIQSPMKKIVLPYRETKKGSAFTKAEERTLVDFCIQKQGNAASSALLVLLYFGLRQSELKSIKITEDSMLECETSKERMGRNVTVRKIPFTPVFRRVMRYVDFDRARDTNPRTVATTLKRLFPNHHPHELRYTFITRCKEAGVNQEVVMLWDGHSFDNDVKTSAVDRGYTTYSDEYIKAEAEKVNYEF